jgi:5-methylcytosine-specific restriction endonuclease McrA
MGNRRRISLHENSNWREKVYKMTNQEALFFKSIEWKNRSEECYLRDRYTCKRCDSISKLTPHHIIPRHAGGSDDLTNLITLCSDCHNFVEYDGTLTSRSLIINSYDGEIEEGIEQELDFDQTRPDWHAWVYGGQRRPKARLN